MVESIVYIDKVKSMWKVQNVITLEFSICWKRYICQAVLHILENLIREIQIFETYFNL